MDDKITKAEYFREHAELLHSVARSLRPDDKNRAQLLNMSYYFERLAEAAERGGARHKERQPVPRGHRLAALIKRRDGRQLAEHFSGLERNAHKQQAQEKEHRLHFSLLSRKTEA